jgi:hypothetical protein
VKQARQRLLVDAVDGERLFHDGNRGIEQQPALDLAGQTELFRVMLQ